MPLTHIETLPALLRWRATATPSEPAQWRLGTNGQWQMHNWKAFFTDVVHIAKGLRNLGLVPGDRLGIMASTCAEWDSTQLAALAIGAVVVGIDIHEHDARLADTLSICQLNALIVGDEQMLKRLPARAKETLRLVLTFNTTSTVKDLISWSDLLSAAGQNAEWHDESKPESPALIVFTSGTTGAPKGIAYTHRQVSIAYRAILNAFPDIGAGARLACWLPLSNLFQRMINFCAIARGAEIYYVDNPREIMQHLPRIAPHVFIAVPRFYEKFFNGLMEKVATKAHWQQRIFATSLDLARKINLLKTNEERISTWLIIINSVLSTLILRPARNAMGGHLRFLVSGSAPMPKWLLNDMAALGLPVYEAYGMSENIVPICVNRPNAVKFGTVGKPLHPNEVRIADDGELLVRGPGLFSGYLGDLPASRDADGYLATGDYAEQNESGFITLTGRKSEIFKTSTGRRVAPNGIESLIKQVAYVEQCMVLGANLPFIVAILWIAPDRLEQVMPSIFSDISKTVAGLPDYQQPAGLILSTRTLSLERGELTTNLKLRRRQIEQNYAVEIDRLYLQIHLQSGGNLVVTET